MKNLRDICEKFKQSGMNIRMPKLYDAFSAEQVVALVNGLTDLQEGFVVRNNKTGQRVKIKNSLYVKVHTLRGNNGVPSQNNLMEMVLTGEDTEFLLHFGEYKGFFDPVYSAFDKLKMESSVVYDAHKHIENQKDFALAVKDTNVGSICFKARKEGIAAYEAFESMELNQKMKLLEKYL